MFFRAGLPTAILTALIAGPAFAAEAPAPIVAKDFVFVSGADSVANLACLTEAGGDVGGGSGLPAAVASALASAGLDPQLVVVLATQPLVCGDIFYQPLANDIRGIGYQHGSMGELFDQTPNSRLEGIAFLNDFPYWQRNPAEFQNDFDHELGHRWGARVHAQIDGADSTELLGREDLHWSYFLNSGGSPLEGNIWSDTGGGQYLADTPLGPGLFSDLDLYAMGVLPPSQVGPQQLLRPVTPAGATDCLGFSLAAISPPQSCGPYVTAATPVTFGIDDVIASEGDRDPPAVAAPVTVDIAVVVLASGSKPFDLASCQEMTDAVPARIADFATASGGLVSLNNLVTAGADCASFTQPAVSGPSPSGGCALAPGGSSPSAVALTLLLVLGSRLRGRRPRVTPSS